MEVGGWLGVILDILVKEDGSVGLGDGYGDVGSR